jgi:ADP-ribose pyrophosphatase
MKALKKAAKSASVAVPEAEAAIVVAKKPAKVVKVKSPAAATVNPEKSEAGKGQAGKARAEQKPKKAIATEKPGEKKKVPAAKTARILDSKLVYEGPLFRVMHDHLIEPDGTESQRDVIKHNGSVVILAVDPTKHKKDPWIVIERQYRHAAGQYLWELPAGKLDAGEAPMDGAKRELAEETGYSAKKWSPLVEYFASPGFLGEAMKVFLAEELVAGEAHPEEDEHIDFRLVKLSELLEMVDAGKIVDGKTLTTILLYARQLGVKRKH